MTPSTAPPDVMPEIYVMPTPRQLQVIGLIANGYSHKEAAVALGISRWSVERHLQRARRRMSMNVIELVAYLVSKGFIVHRGVMQSSATNSTIQQS